MMTSHPMSSPPDVTDASRAAETTGPGPIQAGTGSWARSGYAEALGLSSNRGKRYVAARPPARAYIGIGVWMHPRNMANGESVRAAS